ncbi:MAG: N-formylglutamate deformylase [Woeseiaceae bacterium]|nr:N-formylglutamate deformylase [Woeseiaceae bacterium]
MIETFTFEAGTAPLLVSVPHDGRTLPGEIASTMTDAGRSIPDTDWHVAQLYGFARELGASLIRAEYSRYVVDLNRPADNQALYSGRFGTGLCPTETFDGQEIYLPGTEIDVNDRISEYWQPYHDKLESTLGALKKEHGMALLWDAHSIASRVPRLFEGELPELNIGTWDNRSCDPRMTGAVLAAADSGSYSVVANGRFKGGHITRHYGRPADGVHAIQLELAQRAYMNESTHQYDEEKASRLRGTLTLMLGAYLESAGF